MKAHPALVYGSTNSHTDLTQYLGKHDLYRWDDLIETDEDLTLPPDRRPVLRRLMLLAQVASGQSANGEPDAPRDVIVDHLATLGPDRTSQTAVIGALMACGLTVHTDYRVLGRDWYYEQVKDLGFAAFGPLQNTLLDLDTIDAEMVQRWAAMTPSGSWFLPRSLHRRKGEASQRARELVDRQAMSFTEAAKRLTVEGYPNSHGRVRWYTKAVREAYEADQ